MYSSRGIKFNNKNDKRLIDNVLKLSIFDNLDTAHIYQEYGYYDIYNIPSHPAQCQLIYGLKQYGQCSKYPHRYNLLALIVLIGHPSACHHHHKAH